MVATALICRCHDITFGSPRSHRTVTHCVSDTFRTASRGESQIVMTASLIKPWTFLIMLRSGQLVDFSRIRNHIMIQFHIVGIRIAPIHICLTVVININRGVYIIPSTVLPDNRFADRVFKGTVRTVSHEHSDAITVYRTIHVEFTITCHYLFSPGSISFSNP